MKRCSNCGWFNPDTATRCEKCEDTCLELQEPVSAPAAPMMATVAFGAGPASHDSRKSLSATMMDVNAVIGEEGLSVQCPKCGYPVTADVDSCPSCGAAVRKSEKHEPEPVRKNAAGMSTVRIGEDGPSAPAQLGNKTVMVGGADAVMSEKSGAKGFKFRNLKKTVRDIPEELMAAEDKELFRLVPIDAPGEAPVEMHLDDVVVISGRRYKFQK